MKISTRLPIPQRKVPFSGQVARQAIPAVAVLLVILLIARPEGQKARPSPEAPQTGRPAWGICEREGEKIAGAKPMSVRRTGKTSSSSSRRYPRKIHDVHPSYPDLPPGTVGSGVWIGEFLIGTTGKVIRVWPLREIEFTPPFPPFNAAIRDAVEKWQYEPFAPDGVAVPFCVTVTVHVNWR